MSIGGGDARPPGRLTRRALLHASVVAPALAVSLTACSRRPPLRVASNVWPGYEPLFVLEQDGRFPADMQLVELVSASQVMRGIRTGLVDVGAVTLDEAIRLHAQLDDVVLLAVLDISEGGDALIGGPGVQRLEDLRGRKVGCEESALGLYLLARALEKAGVSPVDVTTVHYPVHEHRAAFESGAIDALVTFEPVVGQLSSQPGKVLFTSRDIPGEVVDVLISRRETWRARRRDIHRLCDTWFEARALVVESVKRGVPRATRRLGPKSENLHTVYDGIRFPERAESEAMLARTGSTLLPVALRIRTLLARLGLARADTPVEQMFVGGSGSA